MALLRWALPLCGPSGFHPGDVVLSWRRSCAQRRRGCISCPRLPSPRVSAAEGRFLLRRSSSGSHICCASADGTARLGVGSASSSASRLPSPRFCLRRCSITSSGACFFLGNDFRCLFLLPLLWPRQWGVRLGHFLCVEGSQRSFLHSPFLLRRPSRSSGAGISSTRKLRRCWERGP